MFLAMNFIVLSISAVDTGRITISRGEKDGDGTIRLPRPMSKSRTSYGEFANLYFNRSFAEQADEKPHYRG